MAEHTQTHPALTGKLSSNMNLLEAVQARPGMYVGEAGWKRGMNCLGTVVDALCGLVARERPETRGRFHDHALLSVFGLGQTFEVALDVERQDCTEIEDAFAKFETGEQNFRTPQTMLRVVQALSEDFCLGYIDQTSEERIIIGQSFGDEALEPHDYRNRLICRFTLSDEASSDEFSNDMIRGYLLGLKGRWTGLVLHKISYEANTF